MGKSEFCDFSEWKEFCMTGSLPRSGSANKRTRFLPIMPRIRTILWSLCIVMPRVVILSYGKRYSRNILWTVLRRLATWSWGPTYLRCVCPSSKWSTRRPVQGVCPAVPVARQVFYPPANCTPLCGRHNPVGPGCRWHSPEPGPRIRAAILSLHLKVQRTAQGKESVNVFGQRFWNFVCGDVLDYSKNNTCQFGIHNVADVTPLSLQTLLYLTLTRLKLFETFMVWFLTFTLWIRVSFSETRMSLTAHTVEWPFQFIRNSKACLISKVSYLICFMRGGEESRERMSEDRRTEADLLSATFRAEYNEQTESVSETFTTMFQRLTWIASTEDFYDLA